MYSYALMEKDCYYLIQEKEADEIALIRIVLISDHCVFITQYGDTETTHWKKKSDTVFDIIELLDDAKVREWESSYYNNEDAYYEDED